MNKQEIGDCVVAVAELCERSGARNFEIGHLYDETEVLYHVKGACWWASARYRGARLQVDDQPSPVHAADGLAHMILDGGECQHCQLRTTTAQTSTGVYLHGRPARPGEAMCVWSRVGATWKRGCEVDEAE